MSPRLPEPISSVLAALWVGPKPAQKAARLCFSGAQWDEALDFTDRTQLTLVLRDGLAESGAWEQVPEPVRQRLDRNLADNTERLRRTRAAMESISGRLARAGIDFVELKGLSHSPDFVADPRLRVQYDLDFYCPPADVHRARGILLELGYEPIAGVDDFPTDHLPTMIRKTGWQFRGNYFDPELPPMVDLHFRLWDAATERMEAPGVEAFWERRAGRVLDLADRLGYAALHALRHLLRGSLRLAHIQEIARFLENHKQDAAFWARWRQLHPSRLRALQSIAFRLAECYFGAPRVEADLPAGLESWIERYAWSPVEALFRPNKNELYLHLTLLDSWSDRWRVARRRLLPLGLPGPVEAVHVPEDQLTAALRLRKWTRQSAFAASRLLHHARALPPTLWGLSTWGRSTWRRQ